MGIIADRTTVGIEEEENQKVMEYIHKSILDASSPPIVSAIYAQRTADRAILIIEASLEVNKLYYRKTEGLDKGIYN